MKINDEIHYLGINKSPDRSSICLLSKNSNRIEIIIKERISRLKSDGGVTLLEMGRILKERKTSKSLIAGESSYYSKPLVEEERLNQAFPYFQQLEIQKLSFLTKKFNKDLVFLSHHYCHARAAAALSPFKKSLIVVLDCSGNAAKDFPKGNVEIKKFPPPHSVNGLVTEACTVYLQDGSRLNCVKKDWQIFKDCQVQAGRNIRISNGLGRLYEASSQFIFNSIHESGKVMGLSAFGKGSEIKNRSQFIKNLNWEMAFTGKGKRAWIKHGHFQEFSNVAASVQDHFEESIFSMMSSLRKKFPDYENLIFTGGSALNCVTNMKLIDLEIFKSIYIPPFPGDECISFGVAAHCKYEMAKEKWSPVLNEFQVPNFGPIYKKMSKKSLEQLFPNSIILTPQSISSSTAELLNSGKIVAWYQGRSESGPRALGYRSILASPKIKKLKNRLNKNYKFRESFRPYGCSVIFEDAPTYFEVEDNFESPFMSFAPLVRKPFRKVLLEVSHEDSTSRVQTVRQEQNKRFYDLLMNFKKLSGISCLLNTSMNVMGEPIVETIKDAQEFYHKVQVDAMVIENYLILRK